MGRDKGIVRITFNFKTKRRSYGRLFLLEGEVAQVEVEAGGHLGEDHGWKAQAEVAHEADRLAGPLGDGAHGHVGGRSDEGAVAADADAEGEGPPDRRRRRGTEAQVGDGRCGDRDHHRDEGHRREEGPPEGGDPENHQAEPERILGHRGEEAPHHSDEPHLLQGAGDDEQAEEEEDQRPFDFSQELLGLGAVDEHQHPGAGQGHGRRGDAEGGQHHEADQDQTEDHQADHESRTVLDVPGFVEGFDVYGVVRRFKLLTPGEKQVSQGYGQGQGGRGARVGQEFIEADPDRRADQHVGRVADQGGGAADVGGQHHGD